MNNLIFAFDADHWGLRLAPYTSEVARQYDDNSRRLVVTGDLPEGWAWSMLVRAGGCAQYLNIISLGPVDGGVGVTLTADMIPISGYYTMQLRGTNGGQTRHTNAVVVTIPASLSGDAQWPEVPSEFSQIEANIIALNQHPPIPGDEGYWLTWDLSTGAYVTSDLPLPDVSVGPPGPPGEAATVTVGSTTTGEPGTQAQVTNSGTESAAVLNFVVPRGATGATPQIQVRVTQLPEGAEPTVEVTGTAEAPVITLGLPAGATGGQGPQGPAGQTPTIKIGQVETLPPGSPVTASITGTPPELVLNLGIPQGAQGTPGAPGEPGGYYAPSVSESGDLTWTASAEGMPPVAWANIRGPQGLKGDTGDTGPQGPAGVGVPPITDSDDGKVMTAQGGQAVWGSPSGGGPAFSAEVTVAEEVVSYFVPLPDITSYHQFLISVDAPGFSGNLIGEFTWSGKKICVTVTGAPKSFSAVYVDFDTRNIFSVTMYSNNLSALRGSYNGRVAYGSELDDGINLTATAIPAGSKIKIMGWK